MKSTGFFQRIFSTKALAVVAAVCLPLGAASAATFDSGTTYSVSTQSGGNAFLDSSGQNAWARGVSITSFGNSESGGAGLLRLKATAPSGAMQDFVAFCMTPWQYLHLPNTYQKDATLSLSSAQLGWVGALVQNAWSTIQDRNSAAAFQIALWEIVSEPAFNGADLSTAYDLGHDNFILNSVGGTGVRAAADNLLASIMSGSWAPTTSGFTLLKYTDENHKTQNLLTVAPVPLPATGLLLLGGFGALAAVKRRKRAA